MQGPSDRFDTALEKSSKGAEDFQPGCALIQGGCRVSVKGL